MLFEARGAVGIGAGADEGAAWREQRPAARDVGEALLLVLGQHDVAELIGATLEARQDRPASSLQTQILGPKRLLGVDVPERPEFGAQKECALRRKRYRFDSVGECAAGLAHGRSARERGRRAP